MLRLIQIQRLTFYHRRLKPARPDMRFSLLIIFLLTLAFGVDSIADELPLRQQQANEQWLVLNNGRVFSGHMTPRPGGGYDITLANGRLFVSSDQVRFRATSMEDAYRRMRASVQHLTPTTHLELARWCLANKQTSFARRELLDALNLDSEFAPARQMLEGMLRDERRRLEAASENNRSDRARQIVRDMTSGLPLPERRSLGGLPKDAALMFTRSVQPLLSNKCGNARCHGAQNNDFSIISVRGNSSAVVAEQNLAAILNQIDLQNPDSSPLLTATTGLHGGSRQLLFPGQTGRRQLNILQDWIAAVADELGSGESSNSSNLTLAADVRSSNDRIQQAALRQVLEAESSLEPTNDDLALPPTPGTQRSTTETDAMHLLQAAMATRHDDFDPDVFNRRFHNTAK